MDEEVTAMDLIRLMCQLPGSIPLKNVANNIQYKNILISIKESIDLSLEDKHEK